MVLPPQKTIDNLLIISHGPISLFQYTDDHQIQDYGHL